MPTQLHSTRLSMPRQLYSSCLGILRLLHSSCISRPTELGLELDEHKPTIILCEFGNSLAIFPNPHRPETKLWNSHISVLIRAAAALDLSPIRAE